MNRHEKKAVSILDSVLDWLCEVGEILGEPFPGLKKAKESVARARELIVLESEDDEPPQPKKGAN